MLKTETRVPWSKVEPKYTLSLTVIRNLAIRSRLAMCPRSFYISFHIFIWQEEYAAYLLLWMMIEFVLLLASTNKSAAKKSMVGCELPIAAWVCDCLWTLSSLINHHVPLETRWTFTKSQQPVWSEVKHTIFFFLHFLLSHSTKINSRESYSLFFSYRRELNSDFRFPLKNMIALLKRMLYFYY